MARAFGDRVRVEYYDMAVPEQYAQHKDLLAKVPERNLFYPLVFIDGELKLVGTAEYYDVYHEVQELLQPAAR